jgi:malate/lactate dehydrogenase
MATYVRAITCDKKQLLPCSAILNGEYGLNKFSMSVPAVIGRNGIEEVKELILADDEQNRLKKTIDTLAPAMRKVEELMSSLKNNNISSIGANTEVGGFMQRRVKTRSKP